MTVASTHRENAPVDPRHPATGRPDKSSPEQAPDPDFLEAAQPPPPDPAGGDGGSEGDDPATQGIGAEPGHAPFTKPAAELR